jgi:hypothetical protein
MKPSEEIFGRVVSSLLPLLEHHPGTMSQTLTTARLLAELIPHADEVTARAATEQTLNAVLTTLERASAASDRLEAGRTILTLREAISRYLDPER